MQAAAAGGWSVRQKQVWSAITCVLVLCHTHYFNFFYPRQARDFFQEWASARNHIEGLPVYTPHEVTIPRYLNIEFGGPMDVVKSGSWWLSKRWFIEINAHPPTSVLLALPFALLSYPRAHVAWDIFCLAALAASGWLILRQLGVRLSAWSVLPIISVFLLHPVTTHLRYGQLNLVVLLLFTCTWAAARSDRPILAGIALGTATAVKIFPGFLLVYLLVQRQWRAVFTTLATVAFLTVATAVILGPQTYWDYYHEVLPRVDKWRGMAWNFSLVGLGSKLFDPTSKGLTTEPIVHSPMLARAFIVIACGMVTSFVAFAALRYRSRRSTDLVFSLAVVGSLLLSPVIWENYFVVLLLPLLILWARLPDSVREQRVFWALAACFCATARHLWVVFFLFPWSDAGHVWQTLTCVSFHLYALLGLFAHLLYRLRQEAAQVAAAEPAITFVPAPERGAA